MSKAQPDIHDAELVLKVYDLRREPVMRASRDAIVGKFWPKTYEEFFAVTKFDHPLNAAHRQVVSYYEMIYGFVKNGVVHADFFLESNNGEGLFYFARVHQYLERFRKDYSPNAMANHEWVVQNTQAGKRIFETFQKRIQAMAAK